MKAAIICPSDRGGVAFLAGHRPLALVPFLGRTLLDLWLAELATRGASKVLIFAADRPEQIRAAVGRGAPWGLEVEVLPERQEGDPDAVRARHLSSPAVLPPPFDVVVLDRAPPAGTPLWTGCAEWLAALRTLAPFAAAERVGMRELEPGVAVHLRARISPSARLVAPCWIGAHAWVGPHTRIGPDSIVEESAYIDDGAEVLNSFVGPHTYVGALTYVRDSIAWGNRLLRWTTGSQTEIVDAFLLCDLGNRVRKARAASPAGRVAAALALILTCPILIPAWALRARAAPLFQGHRCVRAPNTRFETADSIPYWRLPSLPEPWSRWPELWNVVRGEFGWFGNRPVPPEVAATFRTDFERLWLSVPTGMLSLADAEGCADPYGDEARAHASFYAISRGWQTDLAILRRILARTL